MTAAWSKKELDKIAQADDLHIAPFREDGATYGTPTWIWSVVLDGSFTCAPTPDQRPGGTRRHSVRKQAESPLRA